VFLRPVSIIPPMRAPGNCNGASRLGILGAGVRLEFSTSCAGCGDSRRTGEFACYLTGPNRG